MCKSVMIHKKLFKIPSWERNGKFSLYWGNRGTRNSFLGKILGIYSPRSVKWVFIGEMTLLIFITNIGKNFGIISQFIAKVVNGMGTFSQAIPKVVNDMEHFPKLFPKL